MTATGKWTQPGVPHKGWACIDTEERAKLAAFDAMIAAKERSA
jgi:hypothetical protein